MQWYILRRDDNFVLGTVLKTYTIFLIREWKMENERKMRDREREKGERERERHRENEIKKRELAVS